MKSENFLKAFSFLDDEYLTEAEEYAKEIHTMNKKTVTRPRRVFLIAAVFVLMLSLLGCGVIYLVEAVFPGAALPEMPIEDISSEDIHVSIMDVSPVGMTVYCSIDGFDAESFHAKFMEGGSFTLAKKTESAWMPMERKPGLEGEARAVMNDGESSWPIEWSASYGLLEPGDYRITLELIKGLAPITAEFTVENEPAEMETIEAFMAAESYHLRCTSDYRFSGLESIPEDMPQLLESYRYLMEEESFSCYEYRKSGENFLYVNYNDAGIANNGQMYLDGKKYTAVNETPGDRTTPIVSWKEAPDMDFNAVKDLWMHSLLISSSQLSYEYDAEGKIAKITITYSEATGTFEIFADHTICLEILPSEPESMEAEFHRQRENIRP